MYINAWGQGVNILEPGPMTGPEAMGTNWNTGGSLWASGNIFSLSRWLSTGTGCPGRWWSLHPWRYSQAVWTQSWANPLMSSSVGLHTYERSPPTSNILWFWDSVKCTTCNTYHLETIYRCIYTREMHILLNCNMHM